ncbi:MAG: protease-4 [Gammaproteobacteria bacterium]|jgi:protease-4
MDPTTPSDSPKPVREGDTLNDDSNTGTGAATPSSATPQEAHSMNRKPDDQDPAWERNLLERLSTAAVLEQRRARRWGIFFKFAIMAYVAILAIPHIPFDRLMPSSEDQHTALIELVGAIGPDTAASADRIVSALRAAFEDENTAGIVMRVNSPGGSPVQSAYVYDEIKRLRKKHPDIAVYAVISDICASGCYYIAAAADKIYADKGSIVGSIGVLMNGFGFVDAMEKLGIERRLLTAGKHKGLLDPFLPTNPDEVAHLQGLIDDIHQQFIRAVREGRGDRITGSDEELFNGYVWTGERSVGLGLVDALGTSSGVARDVIGAETIVNYTVRDSFVERFADRLGLSAGQGLMSLLRSGPELR